VEEEEKIVANSSVNSLGTERKAWHALSRPHGEEARCAVSNHGAARMLQQRGHPILRDALLRNAPQDEVERDIDGSTYAADASRSLPARRLAGIWRLRARGFFLRLLSRLALVGGSIAIMIARSRRRLVAAALIIALSLC
jgi:hypothetical protein